MQIKALTISSTDATQKTLRTADRGCYTMSLMGRLLPVENLFLFCQLRRALVSS